MLLAELVYHFRIPHRDGSLTPGPSSSSFHGLGRLGLERPLLGRSLRFLRLPFRFARQPLGRPLRSHPSPLRFFLAPNPHCLDPRSLLLPVALGRLWPLCLRPGLALEPLNGV